MSQMHVSYIEVLRVWIATLYNEFRREDIHIRLSLAARCIYKLVPTGLHHVSLILMCLWRISGAKKKSNYSLYTANLATSGALGGLDYKGRFGLTVQAALTVLGKPSLDAGIICESTYFSRRLIFESTLQRCDIFRVDRIIKMAFEAENVMNASRPDPFLAFDKSFTLPRTLTEVNQGSSYSFYGPFGVQKLAQAAANFVSTKTDGDPGDISSTLSGFLTLSRDDCMRTSALVDGEAIVTACWLCVRLFHPTDEYVQPRWHRDGRMFDCACKAKPAQPHSKYAITLLGPPTRVLAPTAYTDEVMASVEDEYKSRAELAERLAVCQPLELAPGQVIRFSWGQKDSPIHSEPDFERDARVFVSVLFGSEQEIRTMCEWRDEVYDKEDARDEAW